MPEARPAAAHRERDVSETRRTEHDRPVGTKGERRVPRRHHTTNWEDAVDGGFILPCLLALAMAGCQQGRAKGWIWRRDLRTSVLGSVLVGLRWRIGRRPSRRSGRAGGGSPGASAPLPFVGASNPDPACARPGAASAVVVRPAAAERPLRAAPRAASGSPVDRSARVLCRRQVGGRDGGTAPGPALRPNGRRRRSLRAGFVPSGGHPLRSWPQPAGRRDRGGRADGQRPRPDGG